MKDKGHVYILLVMLLAALTQCSKTESFKTASINELFPLQVGKSYIYNLDSAVYVRFGQVREMRHHIMKEVIDAATTDNLGRPSYRVRRLLRNTNDTTRWDEHSTYLVTPLQTSLEYIEDNLRFIKLQLPVKDFVTWNGNRYLPDEVYPEFGFNSTTHSNLGSWEYLYENVDSGAIINGRLYDSTVTVNCSITDSTNFPPVDKNGPAFKTVWQEKYAKGVGLISRYISLEEFQPRSNSYPNGYFSGFEVKQTLISYK